MIRHRLSPFLVAAFLCGLAAAQDAVQVSGVPSDLAFPIPAGKNVVLTAEVSGTEPRTVWLARGREARLRYTLSRVAAGRYQVNLADADVAKALSGGDAFQIFAELPDGTVITSIAIRYAPEPQVHGSPRVFLLIDGQQREVPRSLRDDPFWEPALRARLTGQSVVFSAEGLQAGDAGTLWCEPLKLQKVRFEFPADALGIAAEAKAGEKSWQADPTGRLLTLSITPEMRLAWEQAQSLQLVCTEAGVEVLQLKLRSPLSRLDLPADGEFTITQRTSKAVPGSDGFMAVYLDDITAGQARLSLATADGELLFDEKSVSQGDTVTFATRDVLYTLSVRKLVNYLAGDDYALLAVARASAEAEKAEQARIRALLAALQSADAVFVSGKEETAAALVAGALTERLDKGTARAPTVDQFVARFASRSRETGEEYKVRLPGGERVPARTWLYGLVAAPKEPAREKAVALEKPGLPNLHRVHENLYRGGQPTAEGIRELKAMGVKTVVNLRSAHSDKDLLEGTGIAYVEIESHAWHPEEEDVVDFLKAVRDPAKGPYFVHCHHGSDRTGMMIAVYRVVVDGWSKADAIEEMKEPRFGFHAIWTDLVTFVRDLDVESVRRKAGLSKP